MLGLPVTAFAWEPGWSGEYLYRQAFFTPGFWTTLRYNAGAETAQHLDLIVNSCTTIQVFSQSALTRTTWQLQSNRRFLTLGVPSSLRSDVYLTWALPEALVSTHSVCPSISPQSMNLKPWVFGQNSAVPVSVMFFSWYPISLPWDNSDFKSEDQEPNISSAFSSCMTPGGPTLTCSQPRNQV